MKNVFLLLSAVLLFTACTKSNHTKLEVDNKVLEFAAGEDTRYFNITSDEKWKIEADGLTEGLGANFGWAGWYTVEPVYGEGNAKITIMSKEGSKGNNATLKIKTISDHQEKVVELSQK